MREDVLQRAEEILGSLDGEGENFTDPPHRKGNPSPPTQHDLFSREEFLTAAIKSIDTDRITPMDALNMLHRLKGEIQER